MGCVGPAAYHRHGQLCKVAFVHYEIGTCEESGHRSSEQYRTYDTVYHEEYPVCLPSEQIPELRLELV